MIQMSRRQGIMSRIWTPFSTCMQSGAERWRERGESIVPTPQSAAFGEGDGGTEEVI